MSQAEKNQNSKAGNPLLWVSIIVVGLIIFIFTASDRKDVKVQSIDLKAPAKNEAAEAEEPLGLISREELVAPGMRARQYINQVRADGKPYPLEEVMAQGSTYASEGSLADAHLAFFFAAREGHIEAMMTMAEMSDPTLFQAENNLLDQADAIQAYKWYKLALDKGFEPAGDRLTNLHQWAKAEADYGNASAHQLLLNFNQ